MRKFMAALLFGSLMVVGPCGIESWDVIVGPVISGDTTYGGVGVEFQNGFDLVLPVVEFGDNL